jgi:GMP synthase-like glutamine amidotransferase
MRIHCLQHVAFETPGTILEWAILHEHTVSYTYFFEEGFQLPGLNDFDWLLIMGGYMNVDEEAQFPWLKTEKQFISQAIHAGKKVLGICLGSQLIAAALGASVYKGKEKEIGFFPIRFSSVAMNHRLFSHFAEEYSLFHWHGDTFDLPEEATLIASTHICEHQAFIVNDNVLALQFHPEMDESAIELMLLHDGKELEEEGSYIQSVSEIKGNFSVLERNRNDLFLLLAKFYSEEF